MSHHAITAPIVVYDQNCKPAVLRFLDLLYDRVRIFLIFLPVQVHLKEDARPLAGEVIFKVQSLLIHVVVNVLSNRVNRLDEAFHVFPAILKGCLGELSHASLTNVIENCILFVIKRLDKHPFPGQSGRPLRNILLLAVARWSHLEASASQLIHCCATACLFTSPVGGLCLGFRECCDLWCRGVELLRGVRRRRKSLGLDAGEWIRLVGCAGEGIGVGSGHFGLLEE